MLMIEGSEANVKIDLTSRPQESLKLDWSAIF